MQVLMIEDNEDDYVLFSEHLAAANAGHFETKWFGSLGQGLAFLESHHVDVLLLDMGLPDSQGLETFNRVEARFPALPVVIISGNDNDEQALEAVRRGAQDYLVKGQVSGPLLVRAVQYAQERKRTDAALKRFAQRMEILHQIDLGLIRGDSIQALVEVVLKHIRQLIPCQRVSVSLVDETQDGLVVFAVDLSHPSAVDKGIRVTLPSGWLDGYDADHAKIIDDIRLLEDLIPAQKQLLKEGLVTFLHVVLTAQGHPIGLLALSTDTPGFFTAEYREIAIEIASQLAISIHQMHLDEALTRHAAELETKVVERTADLNDAKQRVEAILNNTSDGILLVHPDLKIQQTNSSFNILLACEQDDYYGESLVVLVHAEDANAVTNIIQTVVAEQQGKSIEIRTLRKDGKVFDAELSVGYITDDGLVCTIRDITERKAQERQLRYYASLQESVIDAVIVTDMELHIQTWNPGAERTYGWTAAEVIGKTAPELLQIRHPPALDSKSPRQRFNDQGFLQQETIQRRKDGSDINILGSATLLSDENGVRIGIISVNRDITERKAQERQLRFHASLQENVTDAVIATDLEFHIQSWNPAAEHIYGWRAEEVIGRHVNDVLQTEFPSGEAIDRVLHNFLENDYWSGEATQHHRDGRAIQVLGSTVRFKDENGNPVGVVSVNHDITQRKKNESILHAKMEEEREFQNYLKELQEITIELAQIDQLDDFYKHVVEQGLERLGFERLGLLLYDVENSVVVGTYGTDAQGKLKAEHQLQFDPKTPTGILVRSLGRAERFAFEEHTPLFSNLEPIGFGWNAAAVLWNGEQNLGWLAADNAVHHKPASKPLLDILSLYALTIGTLLARKQTEAALRESEEKFRLLLDAAPVATVITNQIGRITLINNQAETVFGYNRAELVGQSVDILLPDYAREQHTDNRATYVAAPRVRQMGSGLNLFARRKDGSEFPVEIELSYIQTQAGLLVMSFVVDITERKQTTAALEQQRAFLRSVIDASPNTIFVKDYDARFVLANRFAAQMYNTTVDALIGKSDGDFNPSSKEIEAFLEADRRVIDSGEPLFLEEPITNFAGEVHWLQTTKVPIVSADGKSKFVLGVSTDITARKQAETALRDQHEFLQLVINNLPELVTVKDRAGRFQLVNKREAEVHGSTPADMLGKMNADFNPNQAEVNFFLQKDRETLETEQIIFIPEETVFGWYYQTTKIPLKNQDGEYDRLLVVASDITERKQAEEALRQAFEKEKELSELKSRFVSMASHEFRTPLATILALTETLSAYRQRMADEQIEQRLGKIQDQVHHLKDIMDDVLQLARLQARRADFNPVRTNLDSLCRSILDEFQSRADVTDQLLYTCSDPQREVNLDNKLMRQIISNLVSNAIKYSPTDKPITVNLEYTDEVLVLRVRDEGIGIPEADLKHLFEPFHRAANVGTISGTGLGLVIIKESVELHGGTITVESQVGVETTFTVNIPVTADGG